MAEPLGAIEERPIADAIEGVRSPGQHPYLFGREVQSREFQDAAASGRLHHAWLLTGPKGVGKATFAFHAASRLLGSTGEGSSIERQIAQGAHPGLLHIARGWDDKTKRFRTQLSVDDVRRTQAFFGLTAAGGDRRVCIVDPADDMSVGAANALLKILEEPPGGTVFFVISHSPGRLLPTIRSRCRSLALDRLGDDDLRQVVTTIGEGASDRALAAAVAVAEGVPRQAFMALAGDVLKNFGRFEEIAKNAAAGRADWVAVHGLADKLSARAAMAEFDQFHELVFAWISRRARGGGDARSLVRWAALWEKARLNLERGRTFNLDRKQLVLDLFADVFEAIAPAGPTRSHRTT